MAQEQGGGMGADRLGHPQPCCHLRPKLALKQLSVRSQAHPLADKETKSRML